MRTNKSGQPQDLLAWAHQSREQYGIKTPELIPDRDFVSSSSSETTPAPNIYRNNSLAFFKAKYINKVIPQMISTLADKTLREIISTHDARILKWEQLQEPGPTLAR